MIGASPRRREDGRFLTGRGRYVADAEAPGALHAVFLRSPHAHARLRALDASAARAAPGVRLVLAASDLPEWGPLPVFEPPGCEIPPRPTARPALVRDRARFVGEPVALVVAATEAAARDAAEAIEAGWDPLPAVAAPFAALAPGAPELHAEASGNLAFLWRRGAEAEAVREAMARAAHVVRRRVPNPRAYAFPLEPRAALARPVAGGLELLCNGQGVHGMRDAICAAMGLDRAALRVVAPDVGGGFGVKNVAFPEHLCLLHAARLLGAPVRWVATTGEDMAGSAHGRGMHADAALALDAEGRFLALEVEAVAEMGAHLSAYGPWCPSQAAGTAMGGVYAIPLIRAEVRGVFTNTAPMEAYRGAGKPEANFLIETLVDAAARETGRDPQALRALNLFRPPLRTAMGMEVRDGDVAARLAECARLAGREGFAARRAASAARGRLRGFGLTCFLETARGSPGEWAGLSVAAEGPVTLAVGTQSNGQGHETSFPQYAAALLGLPEEGVAYVQADTALVPRGNGHGGARSLHQGGEAIRRAAEALLAAGRAKAARLLQAEPAALAYEAGRFSLPDGRGLTLAEIAGIEGLSAEAAHEEARVTFPNGAHAAEVELDPETGEVRLLAYTAVDDYGRLLNPMLTRGSVMGGVAQGIGQALMERVAYEEGSAQLLSASLMDYALPRAEDFPALRIELREDQPTEANGLGAKGSGQAGAIAAPQAVMAAIRDALGGKDIDMPATPESVWRALRGGDGP